MILVSQVLSERLVCPLTVIDLIMALWNSGGNTNNAGPYREQLNKDEYSMVQTEVTAIHYLQEIRCLRFWSACITGTP